MAYYRAHRRASGGSVPSTPPSASSPTSASPSQAGGVQAVGFWRSSDSRQPGPQLLLQWRQGLPAEASLPSLLLTLLAYFGRDVVPGLLPPIPEPQTKPAKGKKGKAVPRDSTDSVGSADSAAAGSMSGTESAEAKTGSTFAAKALRASFGSKKSNDTGTLNKDGSLKRQTSTGTSADIAAAAAAAAAKVRAAAAAAAGRGGGSSSNSTLHAADPSTAHSPRRTMSLLDPGAGGTPGGSASQAVLTEAWVDIPGSATKLSPGKGAVRTAQEDLGLRLLRSNSQLPEALLQRSISLIFRGQMLEEEASRLVSRYKKNIIRYESILLWKESRLEYAGLLFRTLRFWSTANAMLELLVEAFHVPQKESILPAPPTAGNWEASSIMEWRRAIAKALLFWVQNFEDVHKEEVQKNVMVLENLIKECKVLSAEETRELERYVRTPYSTLGKKLCTEALPPVLHPRWLAYPSLRPEPNEPERTEILPPLALEAIARQLTIMDWDLYCAVTCSELYEMARNFQNTGAFPRLNLAIRHSNRLRLWGVHAILSAPSAAGRAAAIARLLYLCAELESFGNYSSLMSLYSALSHAAVGRLKKSFALLPKSALRIKQRLDELTTPTNNHEHLRQAVRKSLQQGAFAMTYLALLGKDLVATDNALSNASTEHHANMPKLLALDALLSEFAATQELGPSLLVDLDTMAGLKRALEEVGNLTEDVLYEISLEREPRAAPSGSTLDLSSSPQHQDRSNSRLKHMLRSAKKLLSSSDQGQSSTTITSAPADRAWESAMQRLTIESKLAGRVLDYMEATMGANLRDQRWQRSQEIAAALIALAAVRRRSQPLMPEADTISTTSSHSALELASTTGDRRSRADSMGNILDSAAAPPKIRVKPADSSRSSLSVDHAAATDHAQVSASNTARQTGAAPGSGLDSAAAAARHLPPPFPDNVDESRKNSIRLSLAIALEEPPEVEEPVVSTPIPEETVSMTATSESIPRLGMAHASSLDMTPSERQSSVGLIDALGAPAAGTRSQSASPPPASRRAPRLSRSDVEEAYTMLQREIPELTPLDEFATSLGRPMTRDDLALLVLAAEGLDAVAVSGVLSDSVSIGTDVAAQAGLSPWRSASRMARARSASFHAAPVRRSSSTFGLPSRNSFTGRSAEPSIVNIESMDASSVSILSPSGAANVSSRSLPGTQPAAETLDLPAETRSTNSSFHNSPRRIAVSPLRMTSGTTGDYVFSPVSRRTSIDVDTAELNLNTDQQDVANLLAVSPIFNGLARDALAVLTANGRRQELAAGEALDLVRPVPLYSVVLRGVGELVVEQHTGRTVGVGCPLVAPADGAPMLLIASREPVQLWTLPLAVYRQVAVMSSMYLADSSQWRHEAGTGPKADRRASEVSQVSGDQLGAAAARASSQLIDQATMLRLLSQAGIELSVPTAPTANLAATGSLTQQPAEVVQEAKRPSSEARGDPNTSLATTNGDDDDDDETEESFV